MTRNISRCALALACVFTAANAFAQDEDAEPAETEEAAENPEGEPATDEEATEEASAEASAEADLGDAGGGDSKFFIGLRLGYGIPLGKVGSIPDGEIKLNDVVAGQVPIWVDLGYRVTPNLLLGLYGIYGITIMGDFCDDADSCSAKDLRFGIQAQYHVSPGESFNPWFGLGIGYEILDYSVEDDNVVGEGSFKGFEFAHLQAGGDFKISDAVGLGPFVSFSLGQYSTFGFGDSSESFEKKAMHEWLTIGARGTFNL
ncbi:MAG TPA: hypothetical protein VK524_03395 [Polyangiaceae bacterium]|nr:hypothetical protein [Polyangiaceae bacterium]